MSTEKKDEMLRVRMKEGELEELKKKAEIYGIKNVSDLVRISINNFCEMTGRNPKVDDIVKVHNASSMAWGAKMFCNDFDIQKYCLENQGAMTLFKITDENLQNKLLEMYNEGCFDTLRHTVLKSILDGFICGEEMDKKTLDYIKQISVKYIENIK